MSPSNPNTQTNATSDLSLNTLIQEALEKKSTPPKPKRTPSIKRKTQDQNSAEKTKPSKINNTTNNQVPLACSKKINFLNFILQLCPGLCIYVKSHQKKFQDFWGYSLAPPLILRFSISTIKRGRRRS